MTEQGLDELWEKYKTTPEFKDMMAKTEVFTELKAQADNARNAMDEADAIAERTEEYREWEKADEELWRSTDAYKDEIRRLGRVNR